MMTSPQLIADSYERYHFSVYLYIYNKVNNKEEAEDLSQDVFVRLMDYKQMLRPDTVKFFIYTISRFEDKSVTDISEELNLSRRTVENHLFISRKEVREYLKQCI